MTPARSRFFVRQPLPSEERQERFQRVFVPFLRASSFLDSYRLRPKFKSVKQFVLFIGFARSGHSIVGAMLDGHKNAVISHEADVLDLVQKGFHRGQIFSLILRNSERFSKKGRGWSGYDYALKDQWQGRSGEIRVIGDKKGEMSTKALMEHPDLIDTLKKIIRLPVKMILVTRHPLDNIATKVLRSGRHVVEKKDLSGYFELCDGILKIKGRYDEENIFETSNENFCPPRNELIKLCHFLGIPPEEGWLDACEALCYSRPKPSRAQVAWPDGSVQEIENRAGKYPFLQKYFSVSLL